MPANSTDYFTKVGSPGTATTLAAPGHTIGGTSFTVVSTTNWPTDTGVIFAVDTFTMQTVNGVATAVRNPGSYTEWEAVVSSSTSLTSAVLRYGTDQNYSAGANTRVYIPVSSSRENRLVDGLLAAGITLSGGMGAIAPTSITTSGNVTIGGSLTIGSAGTNGWSPITGSITSVTANGNRSYTCATSADNSGFISPGMRLRTTRTVAAPTQCTNLNGTTQYWSKASPAGMTATNNLVVSTWVKMNSYATASSPTIVGRRDANNGWDLTVMLNGTVRIEAFNGGLANSYRVDSYQSIPLNKWVHIAAQLDMTGTATTGNTNSYIMIDGVEVPSVGTRAGTNPTSFVQGTGDLNIGSLGATALFPGKIAQVAIYGAKVPQATILASMNQGLTGTETSLVSAYSFNNSINDLNTTNANNLTANGSVVATNADSPFGGQADGTISSTLDYAIVQKVTSTTLTVQVPEGCTIPTSGGVSAVSYSTYKVPFGFPAQRNKWVLEYINTGDCRVTGPTQNVFYMSTFFGAAGFMAAPIGAWVMTWKATVEATQSAGGTSGLCTFLLSTNPTAETYIELKATNYHASNVSNISQIIPTSRTFADTFSVATPLYLLLRSPDGTSATRSLSFRGDIEQIIVTLENAYL